MYCWMLWWWQKVPYHPERIIVYSNVKDAKIVFHKLPVNEERQKAWIHAVTVSKGKEDFEKPKHFEECSNHFLEGKPTKCNPDPTFLKNISTNTLPTPTKPTLPPRKGMCLALLYARYLATPSVANLWPFCNIINCIFSHCFRIRNSEFLHS